MKNNTATYYADILKCTKDLIYGYFPDIVTFMGGALDRELDFTPPKPVPLKLCRLIPRCIEGTSLETAPLVQSIINASSLLEWQQSYSLDDGFDANYLDNYGWFNLVSPDGAFLSHDVRISVGYWGKGLFYKTHWHEPEEIYMPLSGGALFHSEGAASQTIQPGGFRVHKSNQPHAIDMNDTGLLAMAVWRGPNLNRKSALPVT